ncbi:helix-turn-helix domain-containing protein [Streptomyces longispororuber]|uniref:helix-turn-helix domain-containing protein n=1 Tax=Streptomyces longispororuber TaxID=68230 RepID=UPI0036F7A48B
MLTLGALAGRAELELAFAGGVSSASHVAVRVVEVTTLTLPQLLEGEPQRRLAPGCLVLLTEVPFRLRGRAEVALETLVEQLALDECAGLVAHVAAGDHQPFPQGARDLAAAVGLPLLTTTAPPRQWAVVRRGLQDRRLAVVERQAARLSALVEELPARLADPGAMQRVADGLARALRAQVLVSDPEGVLAAAPATAADALARALPRGGAGSGPCTPGPCTRLVPLAPPGAGVAAPGPEGAAIGSGSGDAAFGPGEAAPGQGASAPGQEASASGQESAVPGQEGAVPGQEAFAPGQEVSAPGQGGAVLAVTRPAPSFDDADLRLLDHAARLLGLLDQARREHRTATDTAYAVRRAAVELLLDAEVDKARRVMAAQTPGLLSPETVRAFVVDVPATHRDAVLRRCETATAGLALAVADPREDRRVLVVEPVRPGRADDRVATALTRLVADLGSDASLGGSGAHRMTMLADAVQEAVTAQRFALRRPDAVALSAQSTDLISVLPAAAARRWARAFLQPVLRPLDHWELLRETLPTALAYPYSVAARRLHVHRNTVSRRVARAAELLEMDFSTVTDRIAVGFALDVLAAERQVPGRSAAPYAEPAPTLHDLLTTPEATAWAESLLCGARGDHRGLLATATAWLAHDAHVEPAARALGLSEFTVRSHLRALESHTARDLGSLRGLRDLQFALHSLTGKVDVTDLRGGLCATP